MLLCSRWILHLILLELSWSQHFILLFINIISFIFVIVFYCNYKLFIKTILCSFCTIIKVTDAKGQWWEMVLRESVFAIKASCDCKQDMIVFNWELTSNNTRSVLVLLLCISLLMYLQNTSALEPLPLPPPQTSITPPPFPPPSFSRIRLAGEEWTQWVDWVCESVDEWGHSQVTLIYLSEVARPLFTLHPIIFHQRAAEEEVEGRTLNS